MRNIFGKKIGQYILLEQLGKGGMAIVYNALDSRIERNVAIKVILPSKRNSQVFLEQFEREAKALANLTHTNIVKVLDYGVEQGQPYLAMEYVQGGTLKQSIKEPLAWQKAAEILAPIARALDYVHSQNIVHRDVKPANILLDEDDHPMLSDFGVVQLIEAKEQDDKTAIGVGVGTPDYMSPEQGMGKETDFRADIYSLGIVFYELVTGTKPFQAETPMAIVIKHTTDEFPLPSKVNKDIPAFVEAAILRAVQKDPLERYESMGQFAQVLELIALGEQVPRKKIEALVKPKPKASKKFPIGLPVMVILALVGIYLGIFVFRNNSLYNAMGFPFQQEACRTGSCVTAMPTIVPATQTPLPVRESPLAVLVSPTATMTIPASPTPVVKTTPNIQEINQSGLTLQGTPISPVVVNSRKEIARWGIGWVNDAVWSPDGTLIALGTTSGIFIYDSQSHERKLFINADFNVIKLTFNPNGQSIVAASKDGQVKVWSVTTGNLEHQYSYRRPNSDWINRVPYVTAISYSLDGKNLAIGYENGAINYFSVDSDTPIFAVEQYPAVSDLAINADGKLLYVSNNGASMIVWDIATRKKLKELPLPTAINKIRLSKDRLFVLCGWTDSHVVYIVDLSLEKTINSFSHLGGNAMDFDFSNDNQLIAIGVSTGEIKIFTKPEIKDYDKFPVAVRSISGYKDKILGLEFSPEKTIIATSNWEEGLKIWDAQTGENIYELGQINPSINRMYLSPDAQWLATGYADNTVRVWHVSSAVDTYHFEGYLPNGSPFSPDNRFLATIQISENKFGEDSIRVVDLSNGAVVTTLPGFLANAFVRFTNDSKLLVMGTPLGAIIWDVAAWEPLKTHAVLTPGCGQFLDPQNKKMVVITDADIFFKSGSYVVKKCGIKEEVFIPGDLASQQTKIFASGSSDGTIHIWVNP